MNDNVMRGHRLDGGSRPPKTYSTERLCAANECDTKLSRYNRREFCFSHAPVKYPRLRGRIVNNQA